MDKQNLVSYSNKAACYIELKELSQAMSILDQAIEVYNETLYENKNFVNFAKILERKGRVFYLQGDFDNSIEMYKKSLLENNNPKVWAVLKDVEREKKKQEELKYIDPELSNQHWEKGNEMYKEGRFGDAVKEYEEAVWRNPKDVRNYTNLSSCFIKLMNFNEAKRYAEKGLEIEP